MLTTEHFLAIPVVETFFPLPPDKLKVWPMKYKMERNVLVLIAQCFVPSHTQTSGVKRLKRNILVVIINVMTEILLGKKDHRSFRKLGSYFVTGPNQSLMQSSNLHVRGRGSNGSYGDGDPRFDLEV